MRVVVCGSRSWLWTHAHVIRARLAQLPPDTVVVHGGARGADALAESAARLIGLAVECHRADWNEHGRRAGMVRNSEMIATNPDLVLAFWDGSSRGTLDTVRRAREAHIPVEVIKSDGSLWEEQ